MGSHDNQVDLAFLGQGEDFMGYIADEYALLNFNICTVCLNKDVHPLFSGFVNFFFNGNNGHLRDEEIRIVGVELGYKAKDDVGLELVGDADGVVHDSFRIVGKIDGDEDGFDGNHGVSPVWMSEQYGRRTSIVGSDDGICRGSLRDNFIFLKSMERFRKIDFQGGVWRFFRGDFVGSLWLVLFVLRGQN